jgi:hypothetical protein
LLFLTVLIGCATAQAEVSIEIDLTAQKAWLLQDGQRIYESPISSGKPGHATKPGEFTVTQKNEDHRSSLYGRIVSSSGATLVSDAASHMAKPAGAKFVQAPMKYFIRFDGAIGLHAGHLPGYAASHGCVRLPPAKAALFFNVVEVGTPVRVFGKAPPPPERPKIARAVPVKPQVSPALPPAPPRKTGFPWFRRSAT